MKPWHAAEILRGQRGVITDEDHKAAARVLLAEYEELLLIAVWARRVLDAEGEEAVRRAREGLAAAFEEKDQKKR